MQGFCRAENNQQMIDFFLLYSKKAGLEPAPSSYFEHHYQINILLVGNDRF